MKISVISPSYNQGQFIEEAIQSVMSQNYKNFEHIIIDGGSTDNTIDILNKYPHLIWVSERDKGQSNALNKGFAKATGDIICWLNTDDIYLNHTFEKVVDVISNRNVDAVYSNFKFIDSGGNITKELITQKSSKFMSLFYCFIPSTTFFFKREVIDSGILIDEDFDIAMDKEFFAHIYHSGFKIEKVDSFFAHFRWHSNNKSTDTRKVKKTRLREGVITFNKYSGFKISDNVVGVFFYKLLIIICGVYRTFSRKFKTGVYGNY